MGFKKHKKGFCTCAGGAGFSGGKCAQCGKKIKKQFSSMFGY